MYLDDKQGTGFPKYEKTGASGVSASHATSDRADASVKKVSEGIMRA
jgi:hypothetical protein